MPGTRVPGTRVPYYSHPLFQTKVRKLTAKSLKKFLSGEISGNEDPKDVWENEEVFRQHNLGNFRTPQQSEKNLCPEEGKLITNFW